jgi:hypothetical protein
MLVDGNEKDKGETEAETRASAMVGTSRTKSAIGGDGGRANAWKRAM